jgi:hypothetical protein
MTKKLKVVDIKEKEELEPMVANDLELIEDGLILIQRQVPTDSGPMDILAVDSDGSLVTMELKGIVDDQQLVQGLRYYDWVAKNASWISNAYKEKNIDPNETCRLILVAPDFDDVTKKVAKYLNVELDLVKYTGVELPDGTRTIICENINVTEPPEPPKIYTTPEKLNRIIDEKVRLLCKDSIDQMKQHGIETRPIHGEWFSCWYKNKRFMYLGCKKQFFVIEIIQADGDWSRRIRIATKKEWDGVYSTQIIPACERIEKGTQPGVVSVDNPPNIA